MPVESNIEQLEKLILEQSEYLEKGVPERLTKLASEILLSLNSAFNDETLKERTGKLRRSMGVIVDDYTLTIQMLNYGYFQSFGVKGTKGGDAIGLPPEVASAFGVSEGYTYQFKSKVISSESGLPYPARKKIAEFGIKPKDFYMTDIEDKLVKILEQNG